MNPEEAFKLADMVFSEYLRMKTPSDQQILFPTYQAALEALKPKAVEAPKEEKKAK